MIKSQLGIYAQDEYYIEARIKGQFLYLTVPATKLKQLWQSSPNEILQVVYIILGEGMAGFPFPFFSLAFLLPILY